ncbi:ArsR/SmtB family transcription factor [Streptomyces sp. NPDC054784]
MPAARLSRTRWALSPVGELAALLLAVAEPPGDRTGRTRGVGRTPEVAATRALLGSGRTPLLAAVCGGFTVYLPELLTPRPETFAPTVDEQLHRVATTDAAEVGEQLSAFLTGGEARRRRCPWLPDGQLGAAPGGAGHALRARLERGEADVCEQLARELHQLWVAALAALADRWPAVAAGCAEYVERQARSAAREGFGTALGSLHSSFTWRDDALDVAAPTEGRVTGTGSLTLVPSRFLRRVALHAPLQRDAGQVVVPVTTPWPDGTAPYAAPHVAPVLGVTRLALLKSLERGRTTTELALLHHLTPGSVSYHLSRLLAADLVRRERHGRLVRYSRTARATALLGPAPPEPGGPAGRSTVPDGP